MSHEPSSASDPESVPGERDREFLDFLIELAWTDTLRNARRAPANNNETVDRAR